MYDIVIEWGVFELQFNSIPIPFLGQITPGVEYKAAIPQLY